MQIRRFTFVLVLFAMLLASCSSNGQTTPTAALPGKTQPAGSASTEAPTQAAQKPVSTAASPTQKAAPTSKPGTSANPDKDNIGSAINLVMGSNDKDSVYPSYHIEINLNTPALNDDNTQVVAKQTQISADVQGKNVHLFMTSGSDPKKEGYIIGESEYKMVDGKPQEMMGQIALSWVSWPLQAIGYLAAGSFAAQTGTETYEGRKALVYTIDTSKYNVETLKAMIGMGFAPITSAVGQATIDQQTGGLLKTALDYTTDVSDVSAGKVIGTGKGHIEITVSKIGQVSVKQP